MPGSFVTIDRRVPVSRLKSVDLPTLGRPTITSDGSFLFMDNSRGTRARIRGSNVTFHSNALSENSERSRTQGNQVLKNYFLTGTGGLVTGFNFFVARLFAYNASSARASISSGRSPIS